MSARFRKHMLGLIAACAALAALALAIVVGGGSEEAWQYNQGPLHVPSGQCASADSPYRDEARIICATYDGTVECFPGSLTAYVAFYTLHPMIPVARDFDDSCDAARRAIEGAGALPRL